MNKQNVRMNDDKEFDLKQEVMDLMSRCFTEGAPLYTLKRLSKKDLNSLYALAYSLYEKQEYVICNDIFKFLCMMDHYNSKYWTGLAHTRKLLGWYESAINCFGMLFIFEPDDPSHPMQAAECNLALGNLAAAQSALDHAKFLAQSQPDSEKKRNILTRIQNIGTSIKKHEDLHGKKSKK